MLIHFRVGAFSLPIRSHDTNVLFVCHLSTALLTARRTRTRGRKVEHARTKAEEEVAHVAVEVASRHGGSCDPGDGFAILAPKRREPQALLNPTCQ